MAADSIANRRELYARRLSALSTERSSWDAHWRELCEQFMPRKSRFLWTDVNRGDKRHNTIYDNTGLRSAYILAAGLMAGMTSPARPWFKLATPDEDLNEYEPVRLWLEAVTKRMRGVFARSNAYRVMQGMYHKLGIVGTTAGLVLPHYDTVQHWHPFETGEFYLACNGDGVVDTVYREFALTIAQVVHRFGLENCSTRLQEHFRSGKNLDSWVPVVHVIEPRSVRDLKSPRATDMPFASVYYEKGADEGKFLRESGYKRFRVLAPRWDVTGMDPYGESPGMIALGDTRQLQQEQVRKSQAIDFMSYPPVQMPDSAKNREVEALPGGVTYTDSTAPNGTRNLFDVRLDLSHLLADITDVRHRIKQAFFEDLFLMLANDDRSNITAREIAERHEEKLLMLGPVLERLHNEMLSPCIDMAFDDMVESGLVPPAPRELQDMDLEVRFISVLAQAQLAVGLASVDRVIGTVTALAALKPDVVDKLDADQVVDVVTQMSGADPSIVLGDDRVMAVRENRQQAAAQQAQSAMAEQAANTAKTLSGADTSGKNALTDVMRQFSGYSSESPA